MVLEDKVAVVEEEELSPTRKKWRPTDADHLRDHFMSKPFDQTLTAFYPNDTIEHYGLSTPEKTLAFTRWAIKQSGYRGWYVIVVHDKKGSTVWHPHMLLDGRNDQFDKVKRSLFRFADVNYKTAGRIVDLHKEAGYMAMRACESGLDSVRYELEFMGVDKKLRPRGSRGRRTSRESESV